MKQLMYVALFIFTTLIAACSKAGSVSTPTLVPSRTTIVLPTRTPTPTATLTNTLLPTGTPTATPTNIPTSTPTPVGGSAPWLAFVGRDQQGNVAFYVGDLTTGLYANVLPLSPKVKPGYEWLGKVRRDGGISVAWSPDSRFVVFNDGSQIDTRFYLYDLTSGTASELPVNLRGDYAIDKINWAPGGTLLAEVRMTDIQAVIAGAIYDPWWLFDLTNGKKSNLPNTITWAPDGSGYYYFQGLYMRYHDLVTDKSNNLWRIPPEGLRGPDAGFGGDNIYSLIPAQDPMGSTFLAYEETTRPECGNRYYLKPLQGENPIEFCGLPRLLWFLSPEVSLSPDGRRMLVTEGGGSLGDQEFLERRFVLNLSDGSYFLLAEKGYIPGDPLGVREEWFLGWTPDGQALAFLAYTAQASELLTESGSKFKTDNQEERQQQHSEMTNAFDSIIPRAFEIRFLSVSDGSILAAYPLPQDVIPLLKLYNRHQDNGLGLGLGYPLVQDR